tara:strand:+ start:405 stop:581 length:177 start_codon:yes stop_codon:yes gene_type:complete
MENAVITDVKYIFDDTETQISAVVDGVEMTVPKWPGNSHYDEIKTRVDAGTLTIAAYE